MKLEDTSLSKVVIGFVSQKYLTNIYDTMMALDDPWIAKQDFVSIHVWRKIWAKNRVSVSQCVYVLVLPLAHKPAGQWLH